MVLPEKRGEQLFIVSEVTITKMLFRQLREDIAIVKEKDPAARSSFEILLTYSGLKAVRSYRRAHWFYQHKWYTIARIISQSARHKTGI